MRKKYMWKVLSYWSRYPDYFWGDFNDPRMALPALIANLPPGYFLSIGCGVGVLESFLPSNIDSVGIDIDESKLACAAKEIPNIPFIKADCCRLPFSSNIFDRVMAIAIIEFVTDKIGFVSEVHRVMKNDGSFFIMTPNREHPDYVNSKNKMTPYELGSVLRTSFSKIENFDITLDNEINNRWILMEGKNNG